MFAALSSSADYTRLHECDSTGDGSIMLSPLDDDSDRALLSTSLTVECCHQGRRWGVFIVDEQTDGQEDRYQRITLRIPRQLHAELMEIADASSRSMNAEIINRLEFSLSETKAIEKIGIDVRTMRELSNELKDTMSTLKEQMILSRKQTKTT